MSTLGRLPERGDGDALLLAARQFVEALGRA